MLKQSLPVDRQDMLKLLLSFPQQFEEALQIGKKFDHKFDPLKIEQLVFAGMGGSAIGGDLIIAILNEKLKIPASVNRNYFLPHFAKQSTLVIISSYSGDTEESISCYQDARDKKCQLVCLTSGGELQRLAQRDGVPVIIIPGGMPPRCALAYLSLPVLVFLINSGLVNLPETDFIETAALLKQKSISYAPQSPANLAVELAQKLVGRIPIIYCSSDLLPVVAWRWKGQLAENAKVLAFTNVFPELNHNEIVGWQQLPDLLQRFQVVYLWDRFDYVRNQAREKITREILEKVTRTIIELNTEGGSKLCRLFSLIYLGDMVSYYLAIENSIDPTPIEKIQALKEALKKIK